MGGVTEEHVDACRDNGTCVQFQTIPASTMTSSFLGSRRTVLALASNDGLVVLHDPLALTEENALLSVVNVESPVRRIGFFGPG